MAFGLWGSPADTIAKLTGATKGATGIGSYFSNLGNAYKSDWDNLTNFFSDPLGTIDGWANPRPELMNDEAAKAWEASAKTNADSLQGNVQGYLDQGTQGIDPATAAQMQAAQAQAAQMQGYGQMQAAGFNPNQFMRDWGNAQGMIAGAAMGASSPFGQALNQVAARQAALGGEAALAAMPGARNSGAGMAAFGQAYADPFAQAQVAQQQMQGNIYGQLSGQAMNQFGSNAQFGSNLQQQANQANAGFLQDYYARNAGFNQEANLANAGFNQQANMTNAQMQQQIELQNQLMQNAMRDRQMQAGQITQNGALGWGNIGAGMAADQSYLYQPISPFDQLLNFGNTAVNIAGLASGM